MRWKPCPHTDSAAMTTHVAANDAIRCHVCRLFHQPTSAVPMMAGHSLIMVAHPKRMPETFGCRTSVTSVAATSTAGTISQRVHSRGPKNTPKRTQNPAPHQRRLAVSQTKNPTSTTNNIQMDTVILSAEEKIMVSHFKTATIHMTGTGYSCMAPEPGSSRPLK